MNIRRIDGWTDLLEGEAFNHILTVIVQKIWVGDSAGCPKEGVG